MIMKYKVIALVGKAGAGKDSLLNEVLTGSIGNYDLHEIVSYTTRDPRQGEIDGLSYHLQINIPLQIWFMMVECQNTQNSIIGCMEQHLILCPQKKLILVYLIQQELSP